MPFTHLHVHTEYSLLDGAIPHKSLFKRCGELGMGAVAMTDHGNMYGTLKFDAAAMAYTHGDKIDPAKFFNKYSEYKVKPIFGCEFYLTSDMSVTANTGGMPKLNHLILLAKDLTGYHNLVKLNSAAFLEGFYYKPRIDKKLLRKHADGLVCLSACLAGEIPQALLKGDFELAVKLAEEYKGIFAPGDFYVELQDHGIDEQRRILPLLAKAASLAGVKAVATNDAHYLRREDAEAQRVLQCISYKTTLNESSRGDDGDYFPTDEFYLKSGEEMEALFKDCPEAAAVTAEIADKCSVRLEYEKRLLPGFTPPDKTTPADYLRKLTIEGLRRKYKTVTEEIRARAEHELEIIENSKFVEYFLIVYDFIRQAESTGVSVGPGRGSGVGSIVAYATGITKVDPIKYGLYFERFLNAERVSMPDFDIDFCIDGRASVIEYVVDKYGKDNVAQIITFGTLSMKSAVKDVGRVLGYGYAETDRISKAIPFMMDKAARLAHVAGLEQPRVKPGAPVPNFVIPEVKQLYDTDEAAKRIIDMAIKLEGLPRNPGMHAAGVVICCDPISNHVPLQMSRLDVTTQFDKKEVEKLGLLKMDFLGLRTLTDIKKALDFIKRDKGIDIDFYNMEYDDARVFELIGSGETHAVFQLESAGMKSFMRKLKPETLEDVIAGISLFRPGPMAFIEEYVSNKNVGGAVKYLTPLLEPILKVTYGVIVYQEQVMQILQEIAGYSLGMADGVRRIISAKDTEAMSKEKHTYLHGDGVRVDGVLKRGLSPAQAEALWGQMVSFAAYAFNKSHAAAYAYLAYQTAYLSTYYRVEFLAAILNDRIDKIEEISNYLHFLKDCGIKVLPPDINKSAKEFDPRGDSVRVGLAAVKNVGSKVIEDIIAERERGGEFKDFEDFLSRCEGLNRKMLESLIFAGAFDCFGRSRSSLIAVSGKALEAMAETRRVMSTGQLSMFELMAESGIEYERIKYPDIPEYDRLAKLKYEKDVLGIYISGHPLTRFAKETAALQTNVGFLQSYIEGEEGEKIFENASDRQNVTLIGILMDVQKRVSKKTGNESKTGRLEDMYGAIEINLPEKSYNKYKDIFVDDNIVTVEGTLSVREGNLSVWANSLRVMVEAGGAADHTQSALYIKADVNDAAVLDAVEDILRNYPGKSPVRIYDTVSKRVYPHDLTVSACETLRKELSSVVGVPNVAVVNV